MTLSEWQARLHSHFTDLRIRRSEAGQTSPVFALEHGLGTDEIANLKFAIREHIRQGRPSIGHTLPWIVYAAEIGYEYEGQEYWQTFGESTPGWETFGDRNWIRARYRDFRDKYNGAEPTGPWAQWFNIICWPIHHAILPRDLQYELARVLYRIRDSLYADVLGSPESVGRLINVNAWDTKPRFQKLTQDPRLVGQLALALILEGHDEANSLILPETLDRIRRDLEAQLEAREWLSQATSTARRVRLLGLSPVQSNVLAALGDSPQKLREQAKALRMEPRLLLYPSDESGWKVRLELPNFEHLLARFPGLRETLANSRCEVEGTNGRRLPGSRLLNRNQSVTISQWPRPSMPLLRLDNPPDELRLLLQTDVLLSPGPTWLFKIGSDNVGRELRALSVRSGQNYVLLSAADMVEKHPWLVSVPIGCEGICAALLEVPAAGRPEFDEFLGELGLTQARTLRVWPAGLTAPQWDGEGNAEWLTTDTPIIGIGVDYAVDSLNVKLDGPQGASVEIPAMEAGKPEFVRLPSLAPGLHSLQITVDRDNQEVIGHLEISVRSPHAWTPTDSVHGAFAVYVDPRVPAMEELWEGRVAIEISGPSSKQIRCTISLFKGDDRNPMTKKTYELPLPVDTQGWRTFFEDQIRGDTQIQRAYDLARSLRLDIDAGDLGSISLVCAREFRSLRWHLDRGQDGYKLRLLDDLGSSDPIVIYRAEFGTPDVFEAVLTPHQPLNGDIAFASAHEGGLYVAKSQEFEAVLIVPSVPRGQMGLKQLSRIFVKPKVDSSTRKPESVDRILHSLGRWLNAKHPGDIVSVTNQRSALFALIHRLFVLLGGDVWKPAEDMFLNPIPHAQLIQVIPYVSSNPSARTAAQDLITMSPYFVRLSPEKRATKFHGEVVERIWIPRRASNRVDISDDPLWLCEFALRIASRPEEITHWAGQDLDKGIEALLGRPSLVRAARLLVFAINFYFKSEGIPPGRLYPDWDWE